MIILRLIMIIILENNDEEEDNNEGKNNDKEEDVNVNAPPDRFAGTADFQPQAPQVPLQRSFKNLLELYHHPRQCLACYGTMCVAQF